MKTPFKELLIRTDVDGFYAVIVDGVPKMLGLTWEEAVAAIKVLEEKKDE